MKVLTSAQMKEAENGAVLQGDSYFALMERAGLGAAQAVEDLIPMEGRSCLLFCGRGNNGGDGFIAAVRFKELGAKVAVVLTDGYPTTKEAKAAFDRVVEADLPVALYSGNEEKIRQLCGHTDIIVDAVYGTGFRLPLDDLHREVCGLINSSICAVVALDLPTGVCADTAEADEGAVRADFTAVFHSFKPAHLSDPALPFCGRMLPVDIGIPHDLPAEEGPVHQLTDRELVAEHFPPRPRDSHKGNFGHLLCVVGCDRYMGAAALACEAAARGGAGYVQIASTPEVCRFVVQRVPGCICLPLEGSWEERLAALDEAMGRCSAILLGCGLGDTPDTARLTAHILEKSQVPVVLDADGLNAAARSPEMLRDRACPMILTPHLGEMGRLLQMDTKELAHSRLPLAAAFARQYGVNLLLKGPATTIHTPEGDVFYNPTGTPGMARAGSGDILAGLLGAFAARWIPLPEAAACAAWIHGRAGELAEERCSAEAMLPTDILNAIGSVFQEIL